MKRIIAILLCVSMLIAVNTNVLAAEHQDVSITHSNNEDIAARSLPYSNGGVFTTHFGDTFTVDSQTYCSVILSVKGSGSVTFQLSSGNRYYINENVTADGTGRLWHVTLPAGTYNIVIFGGGGTYAFSTTVYKY